MSQDGVTNPSTPDRLRPVHQYLKTDANGGLILDENGVVQVVTEDFDDDDLIDGQFISLPPVNANGNFCTISEYTDSDFTGSACRTAGGLWIDANGIKKDDIGDLYVDDQNTHYIMQFRPDSRVDPAKDGILSLWLIEANEAGQPSGGAIVINMATTVGGIVQLEKLGGTTVINPDTGAVEQDPYSTGDIRINSPKFASNAQLVAGTDNVVVRAAQVAIIGVETADNPLTVIDKVLGSTLPDPINPTFPTSTDGLGDSYVLTPLTDTEGNVTVVWDDRVAMIQNFTTPSQDDNDDSSRTGDANTYSVDFYTDGSDKKVRAGVQINSIATKIGFTQGIVKFEGGSDYSENSLVILDGVIYRRTDVDPITDDPKATQQSPADSSGDGGQWEGISATFSQGTNADDAIQSVVTDATTPVDLTSGDTATIPVAKTSADAAENDFVILNSDSKIDNSLIVSSLIVQDEDTVITTSATKLTFKGLGVTSEGDGGVIVTIPGVDLDNVTIEPDWWTILLQGSKPATTFTKFDIVDTDPLTLVETLYEATAQRSHLNITYFRIKNRGANTTKSDGWYRSSTATSIGTANAAAQREF